MPDTGNAVLSAAIEKLDRVNSAIEIEMLSTALARHSLGVLIERLIDRLDAMDGDPDVEAACEDEGAQCDDEGARWCDGPADADALSLEFGEGGYR